MNRKIKVPNADDKIGKKINYVAKSCYNNVLKNLGFELKSRNIFQTTETEYGSLKHIINFQGDKYNEGSYGSFCINLGVLNADVFSLVSELPSYSYLKSWLNKTEVAVCQFRTRITRLLPPEPEAWWPDGLDYTQDLWFSISETTDLELLSEQVGRFISTYSLPWIDQNSEIQNFKEINTRSENSFDEIHLIAFGIYSNDQSIIDKAFLLFTENDFYSDEIRNEVKTWCSEHGFSVGD